MAGSRASASAIVPAMPRNYMAAPAWDGSVTMEIQGTEENIDCVIEKGDRGREVCKDREHGQPDDSGGIRGTRI